MFDKWANVSCFACFRAFKVFSVFLDLKMLILASLVATLLFVQISYAQYPLQDDNTSDKMIWCTKTLEEQYKCQNLTKAIERDRALFGDDFLNMTCFRAYNADECIRHIDRYKAHITTLDAGDMFQAGRYHSLVPIMQERFEGGFTNYYAVAVIKAGTLPELGRLADLRNKKACFPWVGSLAGWIIPIYTLQREGGMEIIDCNNQVKTAINFFGDSCAVNALIDKYNPIGDNSDKLCSLCSGQIPAGRCTPSDPYYGYDGAFRCLMEAGEVAFLKHSTVTEMISGNEFKSISPDRFELFCKDGTRRPISAFRECNWGLIPSDALVVSSARLMPERKRFQRFLERAVELYSFFKPGQNQTATFDKYNRNNYSNNNYNNNNPNTHYNNNYNSNNYNTNTNYFNNPNQYQNRSNYDVPYSTINNRNRYTRQTNANQFGYDRNRFGKIDSALTTPPSAEKDINDTAVIEKFDLFESKRYGRLNLMFQDSCRSLARINEDHGYSQFLSQSLDYIYGIRNCPVGRMTLCITSDPEMEKCVKMRTALKAQLLKPELLCYKGHSHINCMQAISSGVADISVFDAGDVYTGGLQYGLIPFMSEVYNLGEPEYYVVAVGKEDDPDTELTYLKGKRTCHPGINTAAGWTYPMAYLISNGWMRPYGCDSVRAAAEYFTKSCIPGAISTEYNSGLPYDNMCDLCHGTSFRYCRRDASEDYYGHTGAFRCLTEGGGHVAFVKHTTVGENTGGRRREWWARNTLNDDFELFCPDGTRAKLPDYKRCNLGKVKANAIVTRGTYGYNNTQINAYINLLTYAQQLYGREDLDDFSFSMFTSVPPYHDLIFQDATRQLMVIEPEMRVFDRYLGGDFMRARRITDCLSGATQIKVSLNLYVVLILSFFTYTYTM